MNQTRRLAAILAADVAGYSRLIGADEGGTLKRLGAIRTELTDPKIAEHHGRIVKTVGDGLLVEFGSVVDALRCAAEVQTAMAERNGPIAADNRIEFRIGVHQGDVVVEGGDILGDGVNVAARLEALAEPGGICVSARVQEDAAGKLDLPFEDIGEQQLKNIARLVRVYRVRPASAPVQPSVPGTALPLPDKPSIAVLPFANMSGGRVEVWRSGCRLNISVAAPFVWRCLTGSTLAPFPHPPGHRRLSPAPGSHRTWRADFPHQRSSVVASQHCKRLQLPVGEVQFRCQQRCPFFDSVEGVPDEAAAGPTAAAQHPAPATLHDPIYLDETPEISGDAVISIVAA
jgi:class 3 adenylate cyclase